MVVMKNTAKLICIWLLVTTTFVVGLLTAVAVQSPNELGPDSESLGWNRLNRSMSSPPPPDRGVAAEQSIDPLYKADTWSVYLPYIAMPSTCSPRYVGERNQHPSVDCFIEKFKDNDNVHWDLYRYHDDNNDGDPANDINITANPISTTLDQYQHIGGHYLFNIISGTDKLTTTVELIPSKERLLYEMEQHLLLGQYIDNFWQDGNITARLRRFNTLIGKGPSIGFGFIGWDVDLQSEHIGEIIQNGSIPWFNWDARLWPISKHITVELMYQVDLDQGNLSEGLRNELSKGGISLSQTITISTVVDALKWRLDDIEQEQSYLIVKADGELHIHAGWIDLQDIVEGHYDEYLRRNMALLGAARYPIFISFNHEFDGPWVPNAYGEPAKYKQAYEHIIAMAPGNVIWVFGPNDQSWDPNYPTDDYFPNGIDLYAPSIYNWGDENPVSGWREPMEMLKNIADDHKRIAPNTLFGLGEFGVTNEGPGDKVDWIRKFPAAAKHYKLSVANYFDVNIDSSWPLTIPCEFADAFQEAVIDDPYFSGILLYPQNKMQEIIIPECNINHR